MPLQKRLFDIFVAIVLGIIFLPFILVISVIILIKSGRPIFYISERMTTVDRGFRLFKFRTMAPSTGDNSGVSGGDKANRVTKLGAFLRKTRLDELPQLWNVLIGDMSFVGPRPPLRQYVERFPELYAEVLESRPGITGMASIYFHKHEERLLARSTGIEETDRIYTRSCIPRKARLDLSYQKNWSLCFDCELMLKSVFKTWM